MEEDAKPAKEIRRDRLSWAEITDSEKIERLREIVKRTQAENAELRRMLCELQETATKHEHGANGQPLIPAATLGRRPPTCDSELCVPGKEWF